ncbi:MAG: hypothetical protein ISS19_17995 [Bacteroidales bacterium]|nr:hypothetical protein [Bacteroidales bacterium]
MKDLCVPIPNFGENEMAEIELRVGDRKIEYNFKVESFLWEAEDELTHDEDDHVANSLARITRLKTAIKNYDKDWELIQIYTPSENATHIQVLYRRIKNNRFRPV